MVQFIEREPVQIKGIMNSEDYFYNLKTKSLTSDQLLSYARSITDWRPQQLPAWATFQQVEIPEYLINADPVLKKLKELGWIGFKIFKNYPNSYYVWHNDRANRPAAINMALGTPNAHTFFKGDLLWEMQYAVLEADYQPDTYMLFNTSKQHSVFNLGEERYLVSVSVPERYVVNFNWNSGSGALSTAVAAKVYNEILKDFKEQNL